SAAGVSTALLATAADATASAIPAALLLSTRRAALPFAATAGAVPAVSAQVTNLVRQGATAMIMAKLKGVAACLLVLALLAGGAGLLARQRDEAKPKGPPPDAPQVPGAAADRGEGTPGGPAKADRHGDPLPAGALARLGTVRF